MQTLLHSNHHCRQPTSHSLLKTAFTHESPSGADQVNARCIREFLTVRITGRAICELQHKAVPCFDDRPSLWNAHVTDWYLLLYRALRGGRREEVNNWVSDTSYTLQLLWDSYSNVHPEHVIIKWVEAILKNKKRAATTQKKHLPNDFVYKNIANHILCHFLLGY